MKKLSIIRPSSLDSFALEQVQPAQPIIETPGKFTTDSNASHILTVTHTQDQQCSFCNVVLL